MGISTAALGWVFGRFGTVFLMLLAAVPLLMGLHLLGLLPFRLPAWHSAKLHAISGSKVKRKLVAFGTGMVFSMAIAPCATPILLGILTLVAMKGNLAYGGVLLFLYGLGSGAPALAVGFGLGGSGRLLTLQNHQKWLQRISGLLLIGSSLYIVWSA
jgi:cytochrome c-type biogenesis protein